VDVGIFAVVRNDRNDTVAGQRVADIAVPATLAALPTAAVEEHNDGRERSMTRCVDIE
jgi:hypothetical protein